MRPTKLDTRSRSPSNKGSSSEFSSEATPTTPNSPLLARRPGDYSSLQGEAQDAPADPPRAPFSWIPGGFARRANDLYRLATRAEPPRLSESGTYSPPGMLEPVQMTAVVTATIHMPASPRTHESNADKRLAVLCAHIERDPAATQLHVSWGRQLLDGTFKEASPAMRAEVIDACLAKVNELMSQPQVVDPRQPGGMSMALRVAERCLAAMAPAERTGALPKVHHACLRAIHHGDGASFDPALLVAKSIGPQAEAELFKAISLGSFGARDPQVRAAHYTWMDFAKFPEFLVEHASPSDWAEGGTVASLLMERGIALASHRSIVARLAGDPEKLQALIKAFHGWFDWKYAQFSEATKESWNKDLATWSEGLSTCIRALPAELQPQAWAAVEDKKQRLRADARFES